MRSLEEGTVMTTTRTAQTTRYRQKAWEPYHLAKSERDNETYWDARALGFSRHSGKSNYVDEFIQLCAPRSDWTAIDVGCGTGMLTVELAKHLNHITGIDVSGKMLDLLDDHARAMGQGNVATIKAAWEDDWDSAGVPEVDLAIESRALLTVDLPAALEKLNNRARRRVCLTTVCGDLAYNDRCVIEFVGRGLPAPPDYIHVVDCLYDMGIRARVDFISSVKYDRYCSREAAKLSMIKMLGGIDVGEEERLEQFMDEHLIRYGDEWVKDYERRTDWAFISWDK